MDAAVPRYAAATVSASAPDDARARASAPRERRRRTLSGSGAAAIRIVVPLLVLLFGSSPPFSSSDSCSVVPNSAVFNHGGPSAAGLAAISAFTLVSGKALSKAITAQQLPAYERNSSFAYGKPVVKYLGLTSAGESIRVCTRHVPS